MVDFRACHPDLYFQSTRDKALALLRWLRLRGLVGMKNQRGYRNLRHALLGQTLRRGDHSSLPIVSSAIFCCLAARMGVSAQCSSFPNHVHAVILAPDGQTVDDVPVEDVRDKPQRRMFVDPFGSDNEIEEGHLKSLLTSMGWQGDPEVALAAVSPALVAIRLANNIRATTRLSTMTDHSIALRPDSDAQALGQLLTGQSEWNLMVCNYAALWALLILTGQDDFEWGAIYHDIFYEMYRSFPEDAWLVEQYLRPLASSTVRQRLVRNEVRFSTHGSEVIRLLQDQDRQKPCPIPRHPFMVKKPHKIGRVFRHKRYGWEGVITGWADPDLVQHHPTSVRSGDDAPSTEVTQQALLRLTTGGNGRVFYTCLYVAPVTYAEVFTNAIAGKPTLQPDSSLMKPMSRSLRICLQAGSWTSHSLESTSRGSMKTLACLFLISARSSQMTDPQGCAFTRL